MTDGASVNIFCGMIELMEQRYPRRAADQDSMNRLIQLVSEIEQIYRHLPQAQAATRRHEDTETRRSNAVGGAQ